jgi:hypothetical protein
MSRWTKIHEDFVVAEKTDADDVRTIVTFDPAEWRQFGSFSVAIDDCTAEPFQLGDKYRVTFERINE